MFAKAGRLRATVSHPPYSSAHCPALGLKLAAAARILDCPSIMPVTATFHVKPPISPPKQPVYMAPQPYKRPTPNPTEMELAAKANELLNYRSKNISEILAQKEGMASQWHCSSPSGHRVVWNDRFVSTMPSSLE